MFPVVSSTSFFQLCRTNSILLVMKRIYCDCSQDVGHGILEDNSHGFVHQSIAEECGSAMNCCQCVYKTMICKPDVMQIVLQKILST